MFTNTPIVKHQTIHHSGVGEAPVLIALLSEKETVIHTLLKTLYKGLSQNIKQISCRIEKSQLHVFN